MRVILQQVYKELLSVMILEMKHLKLLLRLPVAPFTNMV